MKSYPAPPIPDYLVAEFRSLAEAGATQQELIAKMRFAGLSIVPSIKMVSLFYGIPTNEAKWIVHFSDTWADCLQANERLHDAAFAAAKELGFEEVVGETSGADERSTLQTAL
jgi:hypothetical protein